MDFKVIQAGEEVAAGQCPKSDTLVFQATEGTAFLQVEISERELRITGDGGASRRGVWELEVAIPRVNER